MNKTFLLSGAAGGMLCALLSTSLSAHSVLESHDGNPVIMTVAGKDISLDEFKYSYYKNADIEGAVEKKTPAEYAEMFLNYKLKVAAAEAAGIDTLTSFRNEFSGYRDMQLMPMLVDSAYIDSVALAAYQQTADRLQGKDMLRLQHLLIMVPAGADADADRKAHATADSLLEVLHAGADFADVANRHSEDPGSAKKGGELPWIGPGMTLAEFEEAAYRLEKAGDMTGVVRTSVGYHIIRLLERKALEPFETLRPQILKGLKRQGIEEASAEARLKKLTTEGGKTREEVMDSLLSARISEDPNMAYLIQEYHDGLLLYEISKREVWDKAAADTLTLERMYKNHKKDYTWTAPHFKGFTLQAKNAAALKKAQGLLKRYGNSDTWKKVIKEEVNKDSLQVRVSGPYLVGKGENATVDRYAFGDKDVTLRANTKLPLADVAGKVLKKPESYRDVRATIESDYQKVLEKEWTERLRSTYPYEIHSDVLQTLTDRP